jgi:hypothetical protein
MSFLGLKLLLKIDSQLCQAFPNKKMQPFGGASIILVGDLSQFLPISNIPMYASCSSTIALWYTFTISVTLDTIFCQQGDSPTQQEF